MKKYVITTIILSIIAIVVYIVKHDTRESEALISKTYVGNGMSITFPTTFSGNVWRAVTRPPKITRIPPLFNPFSVGCPKLVESATIVQSGTIDISGHRFTFAISEDVGAGQRYSNFCYAFSGSKEEYVINFEIHSHLGCGGGQCGAYCGTEFEQECKEFDMDKLVIQPIQTILATLSLEQ